MAMLALFCGPTPRQVVSVRTVAVLTYNMAAQQITGITPFNIVLIREFIVEDSA